MSEMRELKTLEGALALLDEWRVAYHGLERELARKHLELIHAKADADAWRCLAENYQALYEHERRLAEAECPF